MNNEKYRDKLTKSMTDFVSSPMSIFKSAEELKQGVYIIHLDEVIGIVVSQEEYEELYLLVEELENQLNYAETVRRLEEFEKNPISYTDEEVRGNRSKINLYDSSEDEWI